MLDSKVSSSTVINEVRLPGLNLRQIASTNRPLAVVGLVMIPTLAACLIGLVVDPTVITGAPAWLKPAKFGVSLLIYNFTFLWLLTFIQGHPRLVKIAGYLTAITTLIEMSAVAMQAARGTTSHFNVSDGFNRTVFSIMGMLVVVLWLACFLLGILLLFQKLSNPALAWALRLAVFVSLVGMGLAFFMTSPTAAQLTQAHTGGGMPIAGAHSVGVADGGPGLPVLGWSTVGGDLRAAHFFGLHALQLLPLLGWLVSRWGNGLGRRRQIGLVWTFGLGYLGLVSLLAWQALRGQSIIHPDGLTLAVLGGLVTIVGVVAVSLLMTGRTANKENGPAQPVDQLYHS